MKASTRKVFIFLSIFYLKWIRLKRRMNLTDQVRFTYVNTLDQYTAWKLGKCYTSYILPGP